MYRTSQPPKVTEAMGIHSSETACDGGGGALGHPRVYLHIDAQTGEVACPYCSRKFVYQPARRA